MRLPVLAVLLALGACGRRNFDARHDDAATEIDAPLDYRATVLADRPLAYWRLGESDAIARDEIGGDDGTYSGACTFGVRGAASGNTAVAFNGSNCKVIAGSAYAFSGATPYTVEAWVLIAAGGPAFRNIIGTQTRDATDPIDGYALIVAPTGITLERAIDKTNLKTPPFAVADGDFVHVAATYDGSMSRVYVGGTLVGADPDGRAMPAYSTTLVIGASVTGNNFSGTIDEVAVYGEALSSERIAAHVAAIAN